MGVDCSNVEEQACLQWSLIQVGWETLQGDPNVLSLPTQSISPAGGKKISLYPAAATFIKDSVANFCLFDAPFHPLASGAGRCALSDGRLQR